MKRREITLIIGGKDMVFSERNQEDSAFLKLQEKVRAQRFRFIQENVEDPDNRLAMLMSEMDKVYTNLDISIFISSNPDEMYRIAHDSFKIKTNISFDEFKKMIPASELKRVIELIHKLESEDPKEVKKKKGR